MSIRIVLAGAGGFGRGVQSWIQSSPDFIRKNDVGEIVFIDDAPPRLTIAGVVVGPISGFVPQESDRLICAVGDPRIRQSIVEKLSIAGARFIAFVHDTAVLGNRVDLGEGVVVCPGAVISSDAQLGNHVHVNFNCSLGHDVVLGDYSTLSPAVNIMGEVVCGESVLFGGGAIVLPRLRIEGNVTVGAGAVVTRSIFEGDTVAGVPAK